MTAINFTSRRGEATHGTQTAIGFEQILLSCGILSSLLYVAMNVFLAGQSPSYSWTSQTISELSAIGAPTQSQWMLPGIAYTVLAIAFAWGVLKAAEQDRKLRIAGIALLIFGALGLLWPFAPMHQRAVLAAGGGSLTDTAHIALGMTSVVAMMLAVAFGAAALGRQFRLYSAATVLAVVEWRFCLHFAYAVVRKSPSACWPLRPRFPGRAPQATRRLPRVKCTWAHIRVARVPC
jgi:Protein of unknown function (DUF998)